MNTSLLLDPVDGLVLPASVRKAELMEPETCAFGLSLGDLGCLALALLEKVTLLTMNRAKR